MSLSITKEVYLGAAKPSSGGGTPINNEDISVTINGTYTASEGYTGLGTVSVNVPNPSTGTKSITANGVYDVTDFASADVNVQAGGKYPLLSRVKDDSNNEIGTVVGYHIDANNQKYAVVCLDAQYRASEKQYCSDASSQITDLPLYNNSNVLSSKDTATFNCNKIIDFCNANNYTSSAVSHCRAQSFVIDGTTYYGQLPTLAEITIILMNRTDINSLDSSVGTLISGTLYYWSSTQNSASAGFACRGIPISGYTKTSNYYVVPVLEIPIN